MVRRVIVAGLLIAGCGDDGSALPGTTGDETASTTTVIAPTTSSSSSSSSSGGSTETPTGTSFDGTSGTSGESSESSEGSSSGDSSTGEPLDCGLSPPCDGCTCEVDGWACECPPMLPEAGFVDLGPVDFVVGTPGKQQARTSEPARIFYSYRPADDASAGGPLFVHFNGGPGVSTGILMAFGTGPVRIDEGVQDNPASWTALGDLLYIDARGTGLSYLQSPGSEDITVRNGAFGLQNFNIYVDSGDFIRVLLRFLVAHPQLLRREVVIVGESYGGTRAATLLNILLFRREYLDGGSGRYEDPALVAEIDAFLKLRNPEIEEWTADEVAQVFGRQVLIQPGIGDMQRAVAGELLELPGSPVHALAAELGLQYTTCALKPPDCDPWANAVTFIESTAQRSRYDLEAGSAWLVNSFALTKARLSDLVALEAVLGVAPTSIAGLLPADRTDAFRMGSPGNYPGDGGTIGSLGALADWDRYYLPFSAEINVAFRSGIANFTGVGAGDDHIVSLMLHNMVYVDTFITASTRDVAIYAPSIPATMAAYDKSEVEAVIVGEGEFTVEYAGSPYPGEPPPGARTVRFPVYDASHSVAVDQPAQLRDDVAAWLAGG